MLFLSFSLILQSASYVFIKVSCITLYEILEIDIDKCNLSLNWIIIFRSFAQANQISTRSKVLIKVSFYFSPVRLARTNLIAISNRIYLATIVEKRRGLRARGGFSYTLKLSASRGTAQDARNDHQLRFARSPPSSMTSLYLDRSIYRKLLLSKASRTMMYLTTLRIARNPRGTKRVRASRDNFPEVGTTRPPVRRSAVNCRVPRAATARHRE